MINWDHPSIIRWHDLRRDITALKSGEKVQTQIWTRRSVYGEQQAHTLVVRPYIIVEGYLALYQNIVDLYDKTFYFELDEATRARRRRQSRGSEDAVAVEDFYHEKILKPMHKLYVEPTKASADMIIGIRGKTVESVAQLIIKNL